MRFVTERWNSATTSAEREIVYDVKENLCYTALNYDTELKSTAKYRLFEPPATVELSLLSFELCGQSSDGERLVGLSRGQLDGPEKVESLAFPESLFRALRPELGRREEIIWVRRRLHAERRGVSSFPDVALTFSQDSRRVWRSWLPVG